MWALGPLLLLLLYLLDLPDLCVGFTPTKWSVGNIHVQSTGPVSPRPSFNRLVN